MKRNRIIWILAALLLPAAAGAQCDITLPWSDDFEGCTTTGTNSKPACWTRVDSTTSGSAVYPNVFQRSDAHSKVISFSSQCASCTNNYIYLATPRIPAPLNQLEISFELLRGNLSVFVATDLTDRDSYVLLGSYENASYTDWGTPIEIRTNNLTTISDTGYVVFGKPVTSSYSVSYLDNVNIIALNPCQRPDWVRASVVTTNGATLTWPSVTGLQGYRVSYNTVDDLQGATSLTTTGTTVTLTGLETGTDYYVWVQGMCSETIVSNPRTTTFTTQLPCYAIQNLHQVNISSYAASFAWEYDVRGNEPDGVWVTLHDLTDLDMEDEEGLSTGANYHFVTGLTPEHEYLITFRTLCDADSAEAVSLPLVFRTCGESPLSNGGYDRSGYCPIAAGYNTGSSAMLYDYQILSDMDTISGIALHRYVGDNTNTVTRTLNIYIGNSTLDSLTSNPSTTGLQQVASGVSYSLAAQEWDTLTFSTPFVYDGISNVLVVISDITGTAGTGNPTEWYWHTADTKTYHTTVNSYGTLTNSDYNRPDIRFIGQCHENYDCEAPVAAVSAVDSNTMTVVWGGGTAMGWVVEYRNRGELAWTVVDTVMEESYTLTGLVPSMHYEVRIGALCEQPTRFTSAVPFATSCAIQHLPFHFTSTDMGVAVSEGFMDCWSHSMNFFRTRLTLSHRPVVFNAGNNEWFMLPAIAEPIGSARLRSWIGCSAASTVLVGVASESNCSDVEWVDTLMIPASNPNESHNDYYAYFDSYTGTGNRVVVSPVVDNNYTYVYFFDFHLEPAEGCRPPVRLTLDSADASSMSFSWTPVGDGDTWLVYINGVQAGIATSPSFTARGLNAYTNYEVSVRSYCGSDTSRAVKATFLTGCEGSSCHFTIAGRSATADGWNGGSLVVTSGSREIGRAKMTRGAEQSWTFMVCDSIPLSFSWLSGNADNVCSFIVYNDNGDTLYQTASAVELGEGFYTTANICAAPTNPQDPDDPINPQDPDDPVNPQGIDNVEASHVMLAPNPASGSVTVSGIKGEATVSFLDINGREVYRRSGVNGSLRVDVSGMSKGVYLVRVISAEAAAIRRFVVK